MRELTGEITKEHISGGIARRKKDCAVALAIHSALGEGWLVRVGERRVTAEYGDQFLHGSLGFELSTFVLRTDYGKPVEPLKFSLQLYSRDEIVPSTA